MSAEALIKKSESKRLRLYKDTAGKETIGYGRNLTNDGISDDEAEYLFQNDYNTAVSDAKEFIGSSWFIMGAGRQAALIDLAFNLGLPALLEFRDMRAALQAGAWEVAHQECLNSLAAKEEPARIERDAQILLTGVDPTE